jgi:hypothetical protein
MISVISDCVLATVRAAGFVSAGLILGNLRFLLPGSAGRLRPPDSYNGAGGSEAGQADWASHLVPVSAIAAKCANPQTAGQEENGIGTDQDG